jgi:transcriptional regulator with XRE-family HTH domain
MKLRDFMQQQGLNQAELSRRMNYPDEGISMILSGKRKPSAGFCWRFALAFGFDTAQAVLGDGHEPPATAPQEQPYDSAAN